MNNVVDISKALVPLAGNYASILFAFGFLNASILSASIVPLATAYLVCESLGVESGVNKSFREAPIFHGLYLGSYIIGMYNHLNSKCTLTFNIVLLSGYKWDGNSILFNIYAFNH